MKRILLLTLMTLLLLSYTVFAEKGYIAYIDENKNIMVIEVAPYNQYACASYIVNFSIGFPCTPEVKDFVAGTFSSYGSRYIYDDRLGGTFSIYVDEYGLSSEQAIEWIGKQ